MVASPRRTLGLALAVAVLAAAAPALAAAPKAGSYSGKTSEQGPVTFTVAKGGKKITSFKASVAYNDKCGQGGGPGFYIDLTMKVSKTGKFSGKQSATEGTAKGVVAVSGVISKSSAHGTIEEPKPYFSCRPPNQKINPYSETFTAKTG